MPENPENSSRQAAETLFFEGARHLQAERPAEAERAFRAAVALAPELAEAWSNLGLLLEEGDQDVEAEACYRRALALHPHIAATHVNLGGLLARHKRFDDAEAAYAQALQLDPAQPGTWSNLGVLYASQRLDDEAEACFERALEMAPQLPRARFNLGVLRLRQGRLEEGWQGLEARDWYAGLNRQLRCPRWSGRALDGRSVLIGYEVGHGDMVQFSRYAALLKARGAEAAVCLFVGGRPCAGFRRALARCAVGPVVAADELALPLRDPPGHDSGPVALSACRVRTGAALGG